MGHGAWVIGVCYFSPCSLLPCFFPIPSPQSPLPLIPRGGPKFPSPQSPIPSPQSPLPLIPRGGPEFPNPLTILLPLFW
ncbi:hypothetical protein FDUTEX481_08427 [Tolypothrix sp. PCC 7601]|nr:hypothetical protein FDUTEX481_08427 [Tolypothrix sp. PCC 7601]